MNESIPMKETIPKEKVLVIKSTTQPSDVISPEAYASFISRWTYSWLSPILIKGWKSPLEMCDIWQVGPRWRVQVLIEQLESAWKSHLAECSGNIDVSTPKKWYLKRARPGNPSLISATWNALFLKLFPYGLLKFFSDLCNIFSPLLIKYLVEYISRTKAAIAQNAPIPSLGEG